MKKTTLQSVRIVPLTNLSVATRDNIRRGRMEAAKVWTTCRDLHLAARKDGTKWPNKDTLQKATKGYGLHSQSAQMVCHAFLANIDTTTQLRKAGRKEIRYPWRDKLFYPLMWPAQAMRVDDKRIVLPMGRGRASIVIDKPEWLKSAAACKLVWNGESAKSTASAAMHWASQEACHIRTISSESTSPLGDWELKTVLE